MDTRIWAVPPPARKLLAAAHLSKSQLGRVSNFLRIPVIDMFNMSFTTFVLPQLLDIFPLQPARASSALQPALSISSGRPCGVVDNEDCATEMQDMVSMNCSSHSSRFNLFSAKAESSSKANMKNCNGPI